MNETMIQMARLSQKGYNCSQIILLLAMELRGTTNPDLIRAMAGLGYGCGAGSGSCGVLTGGCCLLALYGAKGADDEEPSDRFMLMLQELSDWFQDTVGSRHGGIECDKIVGEGGPAAARQICGNIVAETYAKVLEILMTNEFDPAG